MTHDPLCPAPRDWWRTCVCDLLEQARADERGKYAADWLAANNLHSGEGTE